jgi:hypothetical protein
METVLTSWKQIAQYFGKGVRTVQRWEDELGLPIHRPKPGQKGVVIAFPGELERWVRGRSDLPDESRGPLASSHDTQGFDQQYLRIQQLLDRNRELRDRLSLSLRSFRELLTSRDRMDSSIFFRQKIQAREPKLITFSKAGNIEDQRRSNHRAARASEAS